MNYNFGEHADLVPKPCLDALPLLCGIVQVHVLHRRLVPAPVLRHHPHHEVFPGLLALAASIPPVDRPVQSVVHPSLVRTLKGEPIRAALALTLRPLGVVVDVEDGVPKAARLPHHWNCAVTHRDELCQATGLEHGRDQDHVAPGVDQVAQGLVVGEDELRES